MLWLCELCTFIFAWLCELCVFCYGSLYHVKPIYDGLLIWVGGFLLVGCGFVFLVLSLNIVGSYFFMVYGFWLYCVIIIVCLHVIASVVEVLSDYVEDAFFVVWLWGSVFLILLRFILSCSF